MEPCSVDAKIIAANDTPPVCLKSVTLIQETYTKINLLDKRTIQNLILEIEKAVDAGKNDPSNEINASYDILFRTYYKALTLLGQSGDSFLPKFYSLHAQIQASLLYGVVFNDYHKEIDYARLSNLAQHVLDLVTAQSTQFMFTALRLVNLFYTKYPTAVLKFNLTKFYFCLQSQSSAIRDECTTFFRHWLGSGEQNCLATFSTITNYWPWTNKYKYILLSAILARSKLNILLPNPEKVKIFLRGVRLSLKYKSLFSAGQLVVRELAKQNLKHFDDLLVDILQNGSPTELIYLNSQWAHHFQNKDELYRQMELDRDLNGILKLDYINNDPFRFVMICTIFEKQFAKHPEIDSIVDHMQDNCFKLKMNTQLYVYKFVANNLMATGRRIPARLQFIIDFITKHLSVPCSDFRNTILGKLPLTFDFISKKLKSCDQITVTTFFRNLRQIFTLGICRQDYQSIIFSLKLFELLLKCFESSTHKSLMKNSSLTLHKALARILDEHNVWSFQDEYQTIFELLSSAGEFDDARELIVKILKDMKPICRDQEFELWCKLVEDPDIDKCVLSLYYARLCTHSMQTESYVEFFHTCNERIKRNTAELEADSLQACKQGRHIFGFYNALNELFRNTICLGDNIKLQRVAIELATGAIGLVLKQLNLTGSDETNASFQTMEESLEMLVSDSSWPSQVHSADRKFLLLSFWLTLKASCELATTIGLLLARTSKTDSAAQELLSQCLAIQGTVLHCCRHKGAIEAAGVSLGQLVKGISRLHDPHSQTYKLLYGCFDILFGSVNNISTTRRGAGLSIMFHHFIKNDSQKSRPLFQHSIKILLEHAKKSRSPIHRAKQTDDECHDNFDALVLHYLCVLVRDSDLKDSIAVHYDEIMMSAIARINDKEWAVRNGALQLFGALVPKIVGQKQAIIGEHADSFWDPSEITFTEFCIKLPKTNAHILEYCKEVNTARKSTSSIILFLEFLSSIEYIRKNDVDDHFEFLLEYRDMFWRFLSHSCEKVRKLSSKCLARFNDFHGELPQLLLGTMDLIFQVDNENFIHGLILFFINAVHKLKVESEFVTATSVDEFCREVREAIAQLFKPKVFSSYVKAYLIDFFRLIQFSFRECCVQQMLGIGSSAVVPVTQCDKNCTNYGIYVLEIKLEIMGEGRSESRRE